MVSLLETIRRTFSRTRRKAEQATEAGHHELASELYIQGGHLLEGAKSLLRVAETKPDSAEKVPILEEALSVLDRMEIPSSGLPEHKEVFVKASDLLATTMLAEIDPGTRATSEEREQLRKIAKHLKFANRAEEAGGLYERLGEMKSAAEMYRLAGAVAKLEYVLKFLHEHEESDRNIERYYADYEASFKVGYRTQAMESLRQCVALAPEPALYRNLLETLESKRLSFSRITLQEPDKPPWIFFFSGQLPLGRDPGNGFQLVSQGVSRLHAIIRPSEKGELLIEDNGSTNGTLVDNVAIVAPYPLEGSGNIQLGEYCQLTYVRHESTLQLVHLRGNVPVANLVWEFGNEKTITNDIFSIEQKEDGLWVSPRTKASYKLNSQTIHQGSIEAILGDQIEVEGLIYTVGV